MRSGLARGLAAATLAFALFLLPSAVSAKYAAIVIEEASGDVLHAVNPDTRHYPASITKLMTLYLLFEAIEANRYTIRSKLRVSARAARQPASKLGLRTGDRISVGDAILSLAVQSANDVAVVVAEALGGTERKFAGLMTAKAKALGMANTRFRNASGLPNRRQLTTARDVATLARAIRRDFPEYYPVFATRAFTYRGKRHLSHNRLLERYAGTDGLKTGYIRASGFNLVASAERAGTRLIAVVLGGRSPRARDLHAMGLLERGFEKATDGRYAAYRYDRNIRVSRGQTRVNERFKIRRAHGARGRMRLARLTPPQRPAHLAANAQGSAGPKATGRAARAWAIQVGTFSHRTAAQVAAGRAIQDVPDLLEDGRVKIEPFAEAGGVHYRAHIERLDGPAAKRACVLLRGQKRDCLPVTPGGGFAPASNVAGTGATD